MSNLKQQLDFLVHPHRLFAVCSLPPYVSYAGLQVFFFFRFQCVKPQRLVEAWRELLPALPYRLHSSAFHALGLKKINKCPELVNGTIKIAKLFFFLISYRSYFSTPKSFTAEMQKSRRSPTPGLVSLVVGLSHGLPWDTKQSCLALQI